MAGGTAAGSAGKASGVGPTRPWRAAGGGIPASSLSECSEQRMPVCYLLCYLYISGHICNAVAMVGGRTAIVLPLWGMSSKFGTPSGWWAGSKLVTAMIMGFGQAGSREPNPAIAMTLLAESEGSSLGGVNSKSQTSEPSNYSSSSFLADGNRQRSFPGK